LRPRRTAPRVRLWALLAIRSPSCPDDVRASAPSMPGCTRTLLLPSAA